MVGCCIFLVSGWVVIRSGFSFTVRLDGGLALVTIGFIGNFGGWFFASFENIFCISFWTLVTFTSSLGFCCLVFSGSGCGWVLWVVTVSFDGTVTAAEAPTPGGRGWGSSWRPICFAIFRMFWLVSPPPSGPLARWCWGPASWWWSSPPPS